MKSYEEVTKDVLERSEEIIANKYKRNRRLLTAVSTSATCLVLAGALGMGIWLSGHQESNIESTNTDLTQSEPSQTTSTEIVDSANTVMTHVADPFELLGCGTDEDLNHRVKLSEWKSSEDYDLYRNYFFGTWEGEFSYLTWKKYGQLIIDDSEKSYLAGKKGCWLEGFYEVSDHVLAFVYGEADGYSLHWLDTDNPSLMYISSVKNPLIIDEYLGNDTGIAEAEDVFVFSASEKKSPVYTLTKTNIVPNEPQNGFLSIFKLHEMAEAYGMDIDTLTDIHFDDSSDNSFFCRDLKENYYPMYLISESTDKLTFIAQVNNDAYEQMAALFSLEKIDGQWTQSTAAFSLCKDIPSDYNFFGDCELDYCYHTAIGTGENFNLDSDAAPQNGTVYISKSLKEAMDFYGDTFNDGCAVIYRINIKYYKNGEYVVPTQSLFDSELERLESVQQLGYDEEGNNISGYFSYGYHGSEFGKIKEYHIRSGLIKKQIDNFTPSDKYGIALFLDVEGIGGYSNRDIGSSSTAPIIDDRPHHSPQTINFYLNGSNDPYPESIPENGTVYFTESLSGALNQYGEFDEDGCENFYTVEIDYYRDGERFDPDEDFSEYEKQRLTELLGEMSFFGLITSYDNDSDRIKLHHIEARLTKSQLESLVVDEEFGCAIYLRNNFDDITLRF